MNKWFGNLLISLGITLLLIWVDIRTNIFNYNFTKVELLIVSSLIWITLNQFDILEQTKEKKK